MMIWQKLLLASDPPGANQPVSLLLHMDGADGSTSFTDHSTNAFAATPAGNAQIDTAQSKFGGASGLFDGTGDFLSVPSDAAFEFGTGDFTIEFWFRPAGVGSFYSLISKRADGSSYAPFFILQNSTALTWYSSSDGSSWDIASGVSIGTVAANTWYHVALTRQGTAFRSFLEGVAGTGATSSAALIDNAHAVRIGGESDLFRFAGHVDEMRITKGLARYTAGFTPPSAAFPNP